MSLTDDAADAIILRWPKALQGVAPKPTWQQRLDWLAFPIWLVRLMVEIIGWLAILGLISQL